MKDVKSLEEIHKRLLEIRQETGCSYEQMSAKIGTCYASLWRWLHYGIKKINPSSRKLLVHFIRSYEEAKERDEVFQFFGEF